MLQNGYIFPNWYVFANWYDLLKKGVSIRENVLMYVHNYVYNIQSV